MESWIEAGLGQMTNWQKSNGWSALRSENHSLASDAACIARDPSKR